MIEPVDVTLSAVTKRYGPVVAVDSIDLTVPKGTYCCLLGPSGCGKTTTLGVITHSYGGSLYACEGPSVVGLKDALKGSLFSHSARPASGWPSPHPRRLSA